MSETGTVTIQIKPGMQIAYIPNHAEGDINHKDVEVGFVTSITENGAFCRYWSKHNPGELRTKANSELTPFDCLVVIDPYPTPEIKAFLAELKAGAK